MRKSVFALPARTIPALRNNSSQWSRRRCFATQIEGSEESHSITPSAAAAASTSPIHAFEQRSHLSNLAAHENSEHGLLEVDGAQLGRSDVEDVEQANGSEESVRLHHAVPPQYLAHIDPKFLRPEEILQARGLSKHKRIVGVVISAGKMDKTVKVRVADQKWNKHLKRNFRDEVNHMVHDPNNSLVTGDVVELHRLRCSKLVQHVVASIINPFGKPISERPPVPTALERLNDYKSRRISKLQNREAARLDSE